MRRLASRRDLFVVASALGSLRRARVWQQPCCISSNRPSWNESDVVFIVVSCGIICASFRYKIFVTLNFSVSSYFVTCAFVSWLCRNVYGLAVVHALQSKASSKVAYRHLICVIYASATSFAICARDLTGERSIEVDVSAVGFGSSEPRNWSCRCCSLGVAVWASWHVEVCERVALLRTSEDREGSDKQEDNRMSADLQPIFYCLTHATILRSAHLAVKPTKQEAKTGVQKKNHITKESGGTWQQSELH